MQENNMKGKCKDMIKKKKKRKDMKSKPVINKGKQVELLELL